MMVKAKLGHIQRLRSLLAANGKKPCKTSVRLPTSENSFAFVYLEKRFT
jgi:hypothetical protein